MCWRSSACWWESPAAGSSADPRVQRPPRLRPRAHRHRLPRWEIRPRKRRLRLRCRKWPTRKPRPLLEKLKADPTNAGLLANIGNVYYDTQQYPTAIDYYQRALKVEPANTGVRTDMATAYWYTGNADTAIAEFQKSLSYEPNKANTLFNLGIVEWQGKMDIDKAVATWQKLLDTNPNYEGKEKVLELMAQAKKHSGVKPGTPAKSLPQ